MLRKAKIVTVHNDMNKQFRRQCWIALKIFHWAKLEENFI